MARGDTVLPTEFAHPRIATRKLTEYLLNRQHPYGKSKAKFFHAFGFRLNAKEILIAALFQHASEENFVRSEQALWGKKYIFEGPIAAPGRAQSAYPVDLADARRRAVSQFRQRLSDLTTHASGVRPTPDPGIPAEFADRVQNLNPSVTMRAVNDPVRIS